MADKVLGLSDRDANLKYGAIQAFVYAFTYRRNLCRQGLGFKITPFGASVMILGNLIIAFSLHFFYLGITLTIMEQVSSSKYFFNGWELYKVGTVVAGFGLFYSGINIGALLGGAVCVYLGTSQTTVGVMLSYQLQLLWLLVYFF
jgi:POT family proton-dependent oligopeptide transporter